MIYATCSGMILRCKKAATKVNCKLSVVASLEEQCFRSDVHVEKHPRAEEQDPLAGRQSREEQEPRAEGQSREEQDPVADRQSREYRRIFENLQPGKRPESESYASLLRLSGDANSLAHAHLAHYHIIQSGRSQNRFLGSLVVQTYVRCGAVDDAHSWFTHMHERNVFAWTFMITEYAQLGQGKDALLLFDQMLHEGVLPDQHILTSIISACGCELDLGHGTQNHARISGSSHDTTLVLGNALVNMYGKCGALENAQITFHKMPKKNVISWTAVIAAYAQHGHNNMAFFMFEQMHLEGVFPNKVTFLSIIDACASLEQAKHVHKFVILSGLDMDVVVATALVSMYGKCSSPENALSTFEKMPERTVVSWNATITVCAEHRYIKEAFQLFDLMHDTGLVPDKISYINVVNALASQADLSESKQMHHLIVQEGYESAVDVATALVHMYGRCSSLEDARCIFDRMLDRTSVSWNYMIRAYSCYGKNEPANQLFDQMKQEGVFSDKFVFSSMITACASKVALKEGKWMHALVMGTGFEADTVVATALVNMYCKCGSLQHARSLFDRMTTRDSISWNAMVDGYAQCGHVMDILEFFDFMQREGVAPDRATFVSILSAFASLVAIIEGRQVHGGTIIRGFETDTAVATAIFNMYAKCGSIQEARQMFEKMPEQNEVSWSAMIAAYAQHGHGKEALLLFNKMLQGRFRPNEVTFVSVLSACSHAGLLDEGRRWWCSMQRDYGITPIADHYDCMIDLYSRVGRLDEAEDLIKEMPFEPTAISWMTLLSACRSKIDVGRGERAAKRMFDLDVKDPSPHPVLSNLYLAAGREEEAKSVVSRMKAEGFIKLSDTASLR